MQSPVGDGEGADSPALCLQVATQLQRLTSLQILPPSATTSKVPALPISTKEPRTYRSLLLHMQRPQVAKDCHHHRGMDDDATHLGWLSALKADLLR